MFLTQVFILGQVVGDFAHGFPFELQAMRIVHQSVKNGVRQGIIADGGVPLVGGQLAEHHGGGAAMAVVHNLHHVIALCGTQGLYTPVINDQ